MSTQPQRPPKPAVDLLWIAHQRRNAKSTKSWACTLCPERRIFTSSESLWKHALQDHNRLPDDESDLRRFRTKFEAESLEKCTSKPPTEPRRSSILPEEPPPSKRPLSSLVLGESRDISGSGYLSIDVTMKDLSETNGKNTRSRHAIGHGINGGLASPFRDCSPLLGPRNIKDIEFSAKRAEQNTRGKTMFDSQRPHIEKKTLWTPQDAPLSRSNFDPSNIASVQAQRSRAQALPNKARRSFPSPQVPSPQVPSPQVPNPKRSTMALNIPSPAIFGRSTQGVLQGSSKEDYFDLILQPETRPISQEQLVAEVKGIYAGLVMVEVKCIEVDNKQAALAQAETGNPPKYNNEQWQALIAIHRTLLHEHHDFFLASQHPSASPALRRLASKYAMPARMWRHGIHSFAERFRHRSPASMDHGSDVTHLGYSVATRMWRYGINPFFELLQPPLRASSDYMLAFISLAYSMMTLLYETVPPFKHVWLECLGLALENVDVEGESWHGVARNWYTIASKSQRICHQLAFVAGRDAILQLLYYAKSILWRGSLHLRYREYGLNEEETLRHYRGIFMFKQISHTSEVAGVHSSAPKFEQMQFLHKYCDISTTLNENHSRFAPFAIRKAFNLFQNRKYAIIASVSFVLFQSTAAAPLGQNPPHERALGFRSYWEEQYRQFTDRYTGPLVMNTAWGMFLSTLYFTITYCDKGRWKGTDLLLVAMSMASGGSFFLGMSESLSGWQLALLWLFNSCLNINFLHQNLSEFPKSLELTRFGIGTLSFASAGMLALSITAPDGRYKNPWVLAAMLVSPIAIFFTVSWLILLRNTGVARSLEDGNYRVPALAFLKHIVVMGISLVLLLAMMGK